MKTTFVGERLQQAIDYFALSSEQAARDMEVSRQAVYDCLKGKHQLKNTRLAKFCLKHSEINREWLIFGEGEMLNNITINIHSNNTEKNKTGRDAIRDSNISGVNNEVEVIKKENEMLKKANDMLWQLIASKDETIEALKLKTKK